MQFVFSEGYTSVEIRESRTLITSFQRFINNLIRGPKNEKNHRKGTNLMLISKLQNSGTIFLGM
jgi:hypothetical protein